MSKPYRVKLLKKSVDPPGIVVRERTYGCTKCNSKWFWEEVREPDGSVTGVQRSGDDMEAHRMWHHSYHEHIHFLILNEVRYGDVHG